MSKDNVKQMFGKIEKDADLQKKYFELMNQHHKESETALFKKIIEFGKTENFSFSVEDVAAFKAELIAPDNNKSEIRENELNLISGGIHRTGSDNRSSRKFF